MAMAAPLHHDNLLARVTLDPSMKPENSPGVIIDSKTLSNQGAEASFGNYLLQMLAGGLITIAAPVAIIIIAISGLMYVVSHGDQTIMDKAKKALTWAIIGLIVIIFSWVIVQTTISIVISTNQTQTTNPSTPSGGNTPSPGSNPTPTPAPTPAPAGK